MVHLLGLNSVAEETLLKERSNRSGQCVGHVFGDGRFCLETLYETQADDVCFTATELINVRPAQPIRADQKSSSAASRAWPRSSSESMSSASRAAFTAWTRRSPEKFLFPTTASIVPAWLSQASVMPGVRSKVTRRGRARLPHPISGAIPQRSGTRNKLTWSALARFIALAKRASG